MKNLKNMTAAIALTAILSVGAASANASAIASDNSVKETTRQCTVKNKSFLEQFAGFIVVGLSRLIVGGNLTLGDESCETNQVVVTKGYRKC